MVSHPKIRDSRVFVDKSVLILPMKSCRRSAFPLPGKMPKGYRTRGFCVQYQENSFNFLNRLFEQEGYLLLFYPQQRFARARYRWWCRYSRSHSFSQHSLPFQNTAAWAPNIAYIDVYGEERDALKSSQFVTQEYNYKNAKVPMKSSDLVHDFSPCSYGTLWFYTGFSDVSEAQNYS